VGAGAERVLPAPRPWHAARTPAIQRPAPISRWRASPFPRRGPRSISRRANRCAACPWLAYSLGLSGTEPRKKTTCALCIVRISAAMNLQKVAFLVACLELIERQMRHPDQHHERCRHGHKRALHEHDRQIGTWMVTPRV